MSREVAHLPPRGAHEAFLDRRHFGSLDGLRGLAIAAVVWHHTTDGLALPQAATTGFLGVDLFFVLSGFLIVTLLLRERENTGGISLRGFYARRTLRIFPAYYGLLVVLSLYGLLRPQSTMAALHLTSLPYLYTFTINWVTTPTALYVAWSLAAEEQFYVIWPTLEKLARRWVIPALLIGVVVNQLVNFGWFDELLQTTFGVTRSALNMLQITFTPICFGVAVAHLLNHRRGFAMAYRALGQYRWTQPLLLIGIVWIAQAQSDLTGWPRLAIQVLLMAWLTSVVVREDHLLAGVLRGRALGRVGEVSYGIYLFHAFVFAGIGSALRQLGLDEPQLWLFPVTLLASYVVAELSFRYFEAPFLRLKRHFAVTWRDDLAQVAIPEGAAYASDRMRSSH